MSSNIVFDLSPSSLDCALNVLKTGGIVVCPSDTVYGLLVDAKNGQAVKKLIAFKQRPVGKAISIFVDGLEMLENVVDARALTESARSLLPGPYTFVLPSLHRVSPLLEAEDSSLGVRLIGKKIIMSDDDISPADFVTTLVATFGGPVTATSANLAGRPSCSSIDALLSQLSDEKRSLIDLIIDVGTLPTRKPSTVMSFLAETPQLLRAGDRPISPANTYISHSTTDTHRIASEICTILRANRDTTRSTVLLLDGEMGAGKTTFMQGLARSLGIPRIVSPTYTFECEYDVPPADTESAWTVLRHYDLYHIQSDEDLRALQIITRLTPRVIACIEWPGRMSGVITDTELATCQVVKITLRVGSSEKREIRVEM